MTTWLMWTRYWTFGFHKMQGISCLCVNLFSLQQGLYSMHLVLFFSPGATFPSGLGRPLIEASRSHSATAQSVGLLWTSDQRRRDLYLTTHYTHKTQTTMSPAAFEPAIPASERPQIHKFDRLATDVGSQCVWMYLFLMVACGARNLVHNV